MKEDNKTNYEKSIERSNKNWIEKQNKPSKNTNRLHEFARKFKLVKDIKKQFNKD